MPRNHLQPPVMAVNISTHYSHVHSFPAAQTATPTTLSMAGLSHSYLVLRDQREGYRRGDLVVRRGDGYRYHSHSLRFPPPPNRTVGDSDLAPLTEEECVILDGLTNRAVRFAVYSTPGKLEWGVGLKVGDTVLARLPDSHGGKEEYTTAIIRWIGRISLDGHQFGVEIKVGELCHVWWVVEGNVVNVPPPPSLGPVLYSYRIGLSKCPHLILLSHSPWGKRQCA